MKNDDYIRHKMALGRTTGTIQAIKNHLACFWHFYRTKRKKLKTINKKDIEGYLFYLRQKNYKPGTIRDRMNGLRDFLHYRNIKTFPDFKISQPKILPKYLEHDELKKVREIIKEEMRALKHKNKAHRYHYMDLKIKERDLLVFDLLFSTGMRVEELCSLNCGNISGQSLLICGKGNKERVVEMPKDLYLRLKKFISNRSQDEALFLCRGKKRLTRSAVSTFVKRYGKKAGLNKQLSPHKLRHSFAFSLLNEGARIEVISSLLGHANLATTQIYAKLSNRKIREEYTKFKKCLEL